jgi:hypothetical protein
MNCGTHCVFLLCACLVAPALNRAQDQGPEKPAAELRLRVVSSLPGNHHAAPAVIWLEPLPGTPALPFVPKPSYTLRQKNRAFIPHLLVIPVGSAVAFPNDDPFFHNVFSLFEGKRFDLGLYEAGSSKSVTFPRAGASYIFCDIHPEMSAVILTLSTPLYAVADPHEAFALPGIPPGDYRLHIWIEGVQQSFLSGMSQTLHFGSRVLDLGTLTAPIAHPESSAHTNKFGKPYGTSPASTY